MDVLDLRGLDDWMGWLAEHHDSGSEAWLRVRRSNATDERITIGHALDGALCFGWIDGLRRGLDKASFLQRYSPRTRRSPWSSINVAKAEALIASGLMAPAGHAAIEAARADGRWDAAYPSQAEAEPPDDLRNALGGDPVALARFESLGRTERYLLMLPVLKARGAARDRAVARAVADLTSG